MNRTSAELWLTAVVIAVGTVCLPGKAVGEAGDGFRTGNLRLSPSLSIGATFDQNLFRVDPSEREPIAAPSLGVETRLKIDTIEPKVFTFAFDAGVRWDQFLSSAAAVQGQSGLSSNGSFSISLNQEGAISLNLSDNATYTNEPPPYPSRISYNRFVNKANAKVGVHPGDNILEFGLGYTFGIYRYPTPILRDLAKDMHQFQLDVLWKFLPKTSMFATARYRMIRYYRDERSLPGVTGTIPNNDSDSFAARAGVSGLLSRRLSLRIGGGYTVWMYENGPDFQGPLAVADLTYKYGNLDRPSKFTLGYKFGVRDSSVGNYYTFHKASLNWNQKFGRRYAAFAGASYTRRDYAPLSQTSFQTRRGQQIDVPKNLFDNQISANAGVRANFFKWWSAKLRYRFSTNITDNQTQISGTSAVQLRRYTRHVVSLSTSFRY